MALGAVKGGRPGGGLKWCGDGGGDRRVRGRLGSGAVRAGGRRGRWSIS